MRHHFVFLKRAFTLAIILLGLAVPVLAQTQTGNLYGTTVGPEGEPMSGATVTLSGGGAPQVAKTDEQGRFRFPGLPPGIYSIDAQSDNLISRHDEIAVNVGRTTEVELRMVIAEVINVTAERGAPLLDFGQPGQKTTVTLTELESIPTARDPWAILQSIPGVRMDRVNVGGSESGQQAQFTGPGSCVDQTVWSLDGMVLTDMAAAGSSPSYYDFDAFEEMQVTTGGSDASVATGGVVMNMVTRRGTNDWRGSGRYLVMNDSTQSDLEFDQADLAQPGPWNNNRTQASFKQGNRIDKVVDWGVELGGPIMRDRLWIWGSYAKPQIDLLTISDFPDKTTLESWNLKLNGQLTPSNSITAFASQSDKVKIGRDASPQRPPETTLNQSKYGPDPTAWKIEDTQILGSSFFVTGMYSVVNGGFQLIPQGGESLAFRDPGLNWSNGFRETLIQRPQEQMKADASSFFNTGSLAHELKFGAGYRTAEQQSVSRWPGGGFECCGGLLLLSREANLRAKGEYTNLFLQDTLAVGNLTVNLGLRYDRQGGENLAASVRANPVLPELLPAVQYAGGDAGFEWETITPRFGLTYALGAERKTLLRASYSRFADQLATGTLAFLNPVGGQAYRYFLTDNNGGPVLDPSEVGPEILDPSANLNPYTLQPLQSNAVDPDLNAPITDELLFGVEHAFRPELVVGLNATYRRFTDLLEAERLVFDSDDPFSLDNIDRVGRTHRRDDYVPNAVTGVTPDGTPYTVNYWELRPGVSTRDGLLLENGDREQEFRGASLYFNKRLANRWMVRGNVSWQDWTWDIPDSENEDPTDNVAGGIVDGSQFIQGSGTVSGAKGNVFISADWSYSVNGLYQVAPDKPWGFNVSANLNGREGYPTRYARRIFRETINAGAGTDVPVAADVDTFRFPDIHVVDLRLEKEFRLSDMGLTLGVDVFNVLNESYVLQRQSILATNTSDFVVEVLSPRVLRLGARLSFR